MKYVTANAATTRPRLQPSTLQTVGPSSAPRASFAVSTIWLFSCFPICVLVAGSSITPHRAARATCNVGDVPKPSAALKWPSSRKVIPWPLHHTLTAIRDLTPSSCALNLLYRPTAQQYSTAEATGPNGLGYRA